MSLQKAVEVTATAKVSVPEWNFKLILGDSGTGKTTAAKWIVKELKDMGYRVHLLDPNQQWYDLTDVELQPSQFMGAVNAVAKRCMYDGVPGVLVVEDWSLTLQQAAFALNVEPAKVKEQLSILLDNVRKYNVKIILVAHEVAASGQMDSKRFQKFDEIQLFRIPVTPAASAALKMMGFDPEVVRSLPDRHYINRSRNGVFTFGEVKVFPSHAAIEESRNFSVQQKLASLQTNREKIAFLRGVLKMSEARAAELTGLSFNAVRVYSHRVRGDLGGHVIPTFSEERKRKLQSLVF